MEKFGKLEQHIVLQRLVTNILHDGTREMFSGNSYTGKMVVYIYHVQNDFVNNTNSINVLSKTLISIAYTVKLANQADAINFLDRIHA